MKYNSFANPSTFDIIISNCTFVCRLYLHTIQDLVKEVTLKNHNNNGLGILHGNKLSP